MTYEEAIELLGRDEGFKASVAVMHTLMIQKGIYTPEEFEAYFIQSAQARLRKRAKAQSEPSPVGA